MRPIQLSLCLLSFLYTAASYAQVAYVYVPTPKGIYAYGSSSSGKLSAVKGSPFKGTVGLAVGANSKFFLTVGETYVHEYEVASSGALGKEVASINTQHYSGFQCGLIQGATLDHTGEMIYVFLNGAPGADGQGTCSGYQTFAISSTGGLTFKGATEFNNDSSYFYAVDPALTITGNSKLAYNLEIRDEGDCAFWGRDAFAVESQSVLGSLNTFSEVDPVAAPNLGWAYLDMMDGDSTNHIATAVYLTNFDCNGNDIVDNPQLASFTAGAQGNLTSTNTYKNMPILSGFPTSLRLNPAGSLLAVALGTGTQFFHFNGAAPITPFTGIIGVSGSIRAMSWDTHNHLYGLNSSGRLHVYTAGATSVKQAAGSPYVVPYGVKALGIIVQNK